MVELVITLTGLMKSRLWLQPLLSLAVGPLTLAPHLDDTCHRPQSRTRRESTRFRVCASLLLEKYPGCASFFTPVHSSFQYILYAVISQSFSMFWHIPIFGPWRVLLALHETVFVLSFTNLFEVFHQIWV